MSSVRPVTMVRLNVHANDNMFCEPLRTTWYIGMVRMCVAGGGSGGGGGAAAAKVEARVQIMIPPNNKELYALS